MNKYLQYRKYKCHPTVNTSNELLNKNTNTNAAGHIKYHVRQNVLNFRQKNLQYDHNLIICESNENGVVEVNQNSHFDANMNVIECNNDSFDRCLSIFESNRKFTKILVFNAQGLLEGSHLEHIILLNDSLRSDIIAIGESWLNKSVSNKLINIDGYKVYRSDRNFKMKNVKRGGGGVCVYVRENLKVKRIDMSNGSHYTLIDFSILEIQSARTKFLFCNLYRHGDCSDSETNELFNRIIELSVNYQHVVVCGDFNANSFDVNKYSKLNVLGDYMTKINDNCATYIAGQFNPSQLDLIFVKNLNDVKHFGHFPAIGISNHQAVYSVMNFFTTKGEIKTYKFRNYKIIDDETIHNFAHTIDWSFFEVHNNIDEMVNKLYQIFNRFLDEICPIQIVTSKYKPVPWMNDEIKKLMSERDVFYKWWKTNRKHQSSDIIYESYKKLSGKIKSLIRESKQKSFVEEYDLAGDSKTKWNLIHKFGVTSKSRKREAYNAPFGDEFTPDKLNEHFTKLKPLQQSNLGLIPKTSQFNFDIVSGGDIHKTIMKIKSGATGPDGIPPMVFKLLDAYICEPIATIMNASFNAGYFPMTLKNVSVTPIPKIDNPISFSHFRPISNANFLLKVFSKISCEQLTEYLETNNILYENQSGFRRAHSCTTAMLKLTEDIHQSISNGKCMVLVLLDFSNAFGSVDHDKLIQCLKSVGVTNHSMRWYKSFISGWHQIVKHGESMSKSLPIERGIVQGENNSQLFFSIFINNIEKYITKCKAILFADDVQIYIECDVNEINDAINIINEELKNIERFCEHYGIEINPEKTKAIIISSKNNVRKLDYCLLPKIRINNTDVEYVDCARNLGYQLNRTNTSTDHIKKTQQKVYGAINTLYPLKTVLPLNVKLQLYKSLILPIFDYMDIIYHNYGTHGSNADSEKLERLQNLCIRYISNVNRRDHITPYRNDLNLLKLYDRRTLHVASMINKIFYNEAPPYLNELITKNKNMTRSNDKLVIKKPNSNFHKSSFYIGAPHLWNELPNDIRMLSDNEEFRVELMNFKLENNKNQN